MRTCKKNSRKPKTKWVLFSEWIAPDKGKKASAKEAKGPGSAASKSYPQNPQELMRHIDKEMVKNAWFKDPNLDIAALAVLTKCNRSYLSACINQVKGMQFCTYVNGFRVTEAKRMLLAKKPRAIDYETVARQSGFNSERSFSRVFRSVEHCTPRQFVRARVIHSLYQTEGR